MRDQMPLSIARLPTALPLTDAARTAVAAAAALVLYRNETIKSLKHGKERCTADKHAPCIAHRSTTSSDRHQSRILEVLLELDEERHRLAAVQQAMIVGQCNDHDGSRLDLAALHNPWLHVDGVHAENGTCGQVQNRRPVQATKDAAVGDGKCAASHVLERELVVAGLLRTK